MNTIVCISGSSRPRNFTVHALRVVEAELVSLGMNPRFVDASAEKALRGVAAALVKFIEEFVHPRQVLESMVRQEGSPWSATV